MISTNLKRGGLAGALLCLCSHVMWSQATAIVMDGWFDDWSDVPSWTDGEDPKGPVG